MKKTFRILKLIPDEANSRKKWKVEYTTEHIVAAFEYIGTSALQRCGQYELQQEQEDGIIFILAKINVL